MLIGERRYRSTADDAVPHHASAHADTAGKYRYAENIQVMPDALDGTGYGKDGSSEQVEK
jgi:hypothetical protein